MDVVRAIPTAGGAKRRNDEVEVGPCSRVSHLSTDPRWRYEEEVGDRPAQTLSVARPAGPRRYIVLGPAAMVGPLEWVEAYDGRLRREVLRGRWVVDGLDSPVLERLTRELGRLARFEHPHVTRLIDFELLEGCLWVTCEAPEGRRLDEVDGGLEPARRAEIAASVARVLRDAHEAELVHGQLAAELIWIDDRSHVRIAGLGLSMRWGEPNVSPEDTAGDQDISAVTAPGEGPFLPMMRLRDVVRFYEVFRALRLPRTCTSMDAIVCELEARQSQPASKRWLLGGVAAVGVGTLLGGSSWFDAIGRCDGGSVHLERVWGELARARVRSAVESTRLSYSGAVADRIEARLDRYTDAWSEHHRRTCEAAATNDRTTRSTLDVQMVCLHRARRAMEHAIEVLAEPGEETVKNAVHVLSRLPDVSRCSDSTLSDVDLDRPADAGLAEAVERVRERLVLSSTLYGAGRHRAALAELESVVSSATPEVDYLQAELQFHRARALAQLGQVKRARALLERAHATAMGQKRHALAADIARQLMGLVGASAGAESEVVDAWARTALALARRDGVDPRIEVFVLGALGTQLHGQGRLLEAIDTLERAIELGVEHRVDEVVLVELRASLGYALALEGHNVRAVELLESVLADSTRIFGIAHPDVAKTLDKLGSVQRRSGDLERSAESLRRAVAIDRAALEPGSPTLGQHLHNLALTVTNQGEPEEAIALLLEAIEIKVRERGKEHPSVAIMLENLANAYTKANRFDEALQTYEDVAGIRERTLPEGHPFLAYTVNNVGNALADAGRFDEALPKFREAFAALEKSLGPEHPNLGVVRKGMGRCLFGLGRKEEALEAFEYSLEMLERHGETGLQVSSTRRFIAQIIVEQPGRRDEAIAMARAAHRDLMAGGTFWQEQAVDLQEWFRSRGIELVP